LLNNWEKSQTNPTRKWLFRVFLAGFVILICELILYFLSWVSPRVNDLLSPTGPAPISMVIEDEELGHRPNPGYPEHDDWGFRNREVPERAFLVVLGDSQTYGVGVSRNQAWPQQLGKIIGRTVYNMAFGGYGPAHNLIYWEDALSLQPKLVMVTFYAGNDLFDSYNLIYNGDVLRDMRAVDSKLIEELSKAEALANRVTGPATIVSSRESKRPLPHGFLREFTIKYSKLYGMLRTSKRVFSKLHDALSNQTNEKRWLLQKKEALEIPDHGFVIESDKFRTILTPKYRLRVLEQSDPRIREGLRISLEVIQQMHRKAKELGVEFMVVLIPTKELVFLPLVEKVWSDIPESYTQLVTNEEMARRTTKEFLEKSSIPYVDTLMSLRQCLERGSQPYQASRDGHPNRIGHRAIAEQIVLDIGKEKFTY
jgi:hypothetical protein